jgi:hypothetical protein
LTRPCVSIARLMAVIGIVALDCRLVRLLLSAEEGLRGLFAFGVPLSLGLIAVLLSRGRPRRFAVGYTAVFGSLSVALITFSWLYADAFGDFYLPYHFGVLRRMPTPLLNAIMTNSAESRAAGRREGLFEALFIEANVSLPVLVVALAGGLLALAVKRRERSIPAPDPT